MHSKRCLHIFVPSGTYVFLFRFAICVCFPCCLFVRCLTRSLIPLLLVDALLAKRAIYTIGLLTLLPKGARIRTAVPVRHLHHPRGLHDRQNGGSADGRGGVVRGEGVADNRLFDWKPAALRSKAWQCRVLYAISVNRVSF